MNSGARGWRMRAKRSISEISSRRLCPASAEPEVDAGGHEEEEAQVAAHERGGGQQREARREARHARELEAPAARERPDAADEREPERERRDRARAEALERGVDEPRVDEECDRDEREAEEAPPRHLPRRERILAPRRRLRRDVHSMPPLTEIT